MHPETTIVILGHPRSAGKLQQELEIEGCPTEIHCLSTLSSIERLRSNLTRSRACHTVILQAPLFAESECTLEEVVQELRRGFRGKLIVSMASKSRHARGKLSDLGVNMVFFSEEGLEEVRAEALNSDLVSEQGLRSRNPSDEVPTLSRENSLLEETSLPVED